MGIQGYTGLCNGIHGDTRVYMGIQGYLRVFKCIHGYTRVYMGTQVGIQGCTWVYKGIQGYTWIYMGIQGYTTSEHHWMILPYQGLERTITGRVSRLQGLRSGMHSLII